MAAILCAFGEYQQDTCLTLASSFYRTPGGTLWPLCRVCAENHKRVTVSLFRKGVLGADRVVQSAFDLPLKDPQLSAWRAQDPDKVRGIIRRADAKYKKLLEEAVSVGYPTPRREPES